MNVGPQFFDLQVRFASRAADVTGISLEDALLHYTNIYVRLGCGIDLDGTSPSWQQYLRAIAGLELEKLPVRTYEFWMDVGGSRSGPVLHARRGCFGFTRTSEQRVHLHFVAGDHSGTSPLSPEELPLRASELGELLGTLPPDSYVHGRSWMYNLDRYRSLFPQQYLSSAVRIAPPWTRLPLWGQILHSDGSVRDAARVHFLERLAVASDERGLQACFRHPVYELAAPVSVFQRQRPIEDERAMSPR